MVVGGLVVALQTRMAVEEEVELGGVDDAGIDNSAGDTVA